MSQNLDDASLSFPKILPQRKKFVKFKIVVQKYGARRNVKMNLSDDLLAYILLRYTTWY